MKQYKVALAGNPNVGKSTVFNALTGLNQHTGNWTGKTVELCRGEFEYGGAGFQITDLPGTYSLNAFSSEEEVTRQALVENHFDCIVVVIDAGALERNLNFALQVLSLQQNTIICLNLYDEAQRKGIFIDTKKLCATLGTAVITCTAVKKRGIQALKQQLLKRCASGKTDGVHFECDNSYILNKQCRAIAKACTTVSTKSGKTDRDRRLDRVLTSRMFGIPIMLLLCAALFWITAVGANVPSEWLSQLFAFIKEKLYVLFDVLRAPNFLKGIIIDGVYTTLSWVVAVMLPPMAIFFPLFSLIEDSGYLPRIAFNLDRFFSKCGAHGKQSLTMMMGLGCNACGVTGCRIIESQKERNIAILTNNFMPCNGRLPILIAMIMMFFAGAGFGAAASLKVAAILVMILVFCVLITLANSKLASAVAAKGASSGFALELPPYRKPQILKTIVRSFLDRTLFVLGRAVIVAAPAGAVIWLCANVYIGEMSVLKYCTDFLDGFGRFIGLDGVSVMAFILGFPANETVIPIIIMAYVSGGTLVDYTGYGELLSLLAQNGWTVTTAVCMIIMTVMHFPCSTTCLTIYKETGSIKTTLLSMLIPTVSGIVLCVIVSHLMNLIL